MDGWMDGWMDGCAVCDVQGGDGGEQWRGCCEQVASGSVDEHCTVLPSLKLLYLQIMCMYKYMRTLFNPPIYLNACSVYKR